MLERCLAGCAALLGGALLVTAQTAPGPATAQIPTMDGGAGPCAIVLTVTADGKPVNAADVKVHIEYGFVGVRRLDLEAYTNADGKLKFTGLPAKVRRPPLEFHARKEQLSGIATYDPATECDGKHDLPLEKQATSQ